MKRVTLPQYLTRTDFRAILRELDVDDEADDRLVIDWSNLDFADPAGLATVAAYAITETRFDTELAFEGFDPASYPARVRMQSVCGLEDTYQFARRDPDDRFTNVVRLRNEQEAAEEFVPDAADVLRVGEEVRNVAQYSLREIISNVHDHTFSPCNAVAACQFYEDVYDVGDAVVYAVADTGDGLAETVRQRTGIESSVEAVETAIEPRFTTATDRRKNPGLGLTVSKAVAVETGGRFRIVTDDVVVEHNGNAQDVSRTAGWDGTVVVGTIPADTDTTLEEVLGEIRDA